MYRVCLGEDGRPGSAIIQGPNHVEQKWSGPMEGSHPLLMPVTNNNTFGAARQDLSPMRFQIAPIAADLSRASRESVMDQYPVTYDVMGKELQREGKLRPFGVVDGEKISDPRNYLFVDYGATHAQSAFTAVAILKMAASLSVISAGSTMRSVAMGGFERRLSFHLRRQLRTSPG